MTEHQHDHDHSDDDNYGLALGFRIFEDKGKMYLAEAEIAPYTDEPDQLGATVVFHPLDGLNPVEIAEEDNWPAWSVDIDDDLNRDENESLDLQFASIVRQLRDLETAQLQEYLQMAREALEE